MTTKEKFGLKDLEKKQVDNSISCESWLDGDMVFFIFNYVTIGMELDEFKEFYDCLTETHSQLK